VNQLHKRLRTALVLAAGVGFAVPTVGAAQDASPEVEYRQSLMGALRLHMGAIRAVTSGVAPAGHVEHHAVSFERMAQALANAFPEGSAEGSRAAPAIWEDRNGFMDQVSAIQSASAQLVTAARSGDADAIGAAMQGVQGTCGDCHSAYRGPAGG
jgi:cytochrome c556